MSDDGDSLTARVAALAAVVVLAVACNGGTADDTTDPSDAAASPDPTSDSAGSEGEASPSPTPTPTPTGTPTGPDDEGWAEHLGLTEEELEKRRASDDFLEFAEARRAREHPRFKNTHGNIGLISVSGDGFDVEDGQGISALNERDVAQDFLLPFRDILLAEGLEPALGDEIRDVGGNYVYRLARNDPQDRQLFMAVAFYRPGDDRLRARIAMAAADVEVIDADRYQAVLDVVEIDTEVTDVAVNKGWDEAYDNRVYDPVGVWLEEHR